MESSATGLSSVGRAFDVLEAFTVDQPTWGLSALARELDVEKSTLHRVLRTLHERGYVRQDPVTKSYQLGLRVLTAARAVIATTVNDVSRPHLQALSRSTEEQSTLWVLDAGEAVCIARSSSRRSPRTHTEPGAREPAHLLASGRCLLASLGDDELEPFVHQLEAQQRQQLHSTLVHVRDVGFEISRGNRWPDVNAVAAPVRGEVGRVVAALAVSAPTSRMDERRIPALVKIVVDAAERLSRDLGAPSRRDTPSASEADFALLHADNRVHAASD